MDDVARAKWLNKHLRRISRMWPPANAALARARVAPGRYQCAICGGKYLRADVHRDHIQPVVDPSRGITGTLELVDRMLCSVDGYQIVCITCHHAKSAGENKIRRIRARKTKVDRS